MNSHLLKLLAFDVPARTRAGWKELRAWLYRISVLRLKPERRFLPRHTLFEWRYLETFDGPEDEIVATSLRGLEIDFPGPHGRNVEEITRRLRAFHEAAATALSRGEAPLELLDEL